MNRTRLLTLLLALLLIAPAAVAEPTTQPSVADRLRDLLGGEDEQADEPSTRPADEEAGANEDDGALTPRQLLERMRAKAADDATRPLVAQIDLSSPISERPAGFNFLTGGAAGLDLRSVLGRLDAARDDADCDAVLLTFYNGGLMNLAQAQEIRGKLDGLRRAGKRTFVYSDTYDTVSYLVASAATDVVLMDGGELFMPGIAVEPTFYKGTLDLLGIQPDYVQIGEYKGAEEPYTRTEPSPELAQEMERLVDGLYRQLVTQISAGRNVAAGEVEEAIDRAMTPSKRALELDLVDHLADADGLRDVLSEELGGDVRIATDYGVEQGEAFDPNNPLAGLLRLFQEPEVDATQPSIAIVYAEGVISGGEGGGDLFGGAGIGSEAIRRAMRVVERDDEIKAVVLRIDSPGGSALASEAMYQAVARVAEKKPVVVSVGDMAASGGYYLAVAGDTIYADPAAVVGSIGVVGGKLVLDGLYDKIGLSSTMFSRGKNAGLFSDSRPWDDRQRRLVRRWMRSTYDQFTDRVAEGRGDRIADVDRVARGRIFLAEEAIELGMVDVLGGLTEAMDDAAKRGGLEGQEYEVVVLPQVGPVNPLSGLGGLPIGRSPLMEAVRLLPPTARRAVFDALAAADLLADRPVIVLSPLRVTVR